MQRNSLRHGPGGVRSGPHRLRIWRATAAATSKSGISCSCSSIATPRASVTPLPKPSIDTGAGLERLAAVLQGKDQQLRHGPFPAADATSRANCRGKPTARRRRPSSLRIIADHSRASAFLIGDGVMPSNEGRGYVLAQNHSPGRAPRRMLGARAAFPFRDGAAVAERCASAYPELLETSTRVDRRDRHEESASRTPSTSDSSKLEE